jgi:hypothetical protein
MALTDVGRRLSKLTGQPLRAYSTFDFGRSRDNTARSVIVPKDTAEEYLFKIREDLPSGVIAFIGTTNWLGDERHKGGAELVVAEGATQFDILRVARSDAVNFNMGTEDLIQKLQSYDEAFGINILQAETDTIQFDLVGNPEDFSAFCQDLYRFCPDIVDQGVGTVEAMEEGIMVTGRVFLWWD